jgi:hypothetical protein
LGTRGALGELKFCVWKDGWHNGNVRMGAALGCDLSFIVLFVGRIGHGRLVLAV